MLPTLRTTLLSLGLLVFSVADVARAQDWPQWRGPNRDAKAAGFKAPSTWPKELTRKWKVEVGDGVASPALVGGKLYAIARQGGDEVIRCLDAATGKEVWRQKYEAAPVGGPARRFSGPRCSPAVAGEKVVTLGVEGVLGCYDATSGKQLWRHDEFKGNVPTFATASSPIIVDSLCLAQLGGSKKGAVVAYDLTTGKEKWKWTGNGPDYGSPVLAVVGGKRMIITPTGKSMIALDPAQGTLLWQMSYSQGRYNAATPIVEHGEMLILAGPDSGMTAEKFGLENGSLMVKEIWRNKDNSVQFNTPVVKDGLLYGLSTSNNVFCIDTKTGATAWSVSVSEARGAAPSPGESSRRGGRGRRGGGGRGGFGSIVDAGPVLLALTPAGQLTVFEPSKEKLTRLATYTVAEGGTYAYPIASGNRIFIKDAGSLTSWAVE